MTFGVLFKHSTGLTIDWPALPVPPHAPFTTATALNNIIQQVTALKGLSSQIISIKMNERYARVGMLYFTSTLHYPVVLQSFSVHLRVTSASKVTPETKNRTQAVTFKSGRWDYVNLEMIGKSAVRSNIVTWTGVCVLLCLSAPARISCSCPPLFSS